MFKKIFYQLSILLLIAGCTEKSNPAGQTEITKWKDGKAGAVSITYDDGIRTQFSKVFPIMEKLQLPATFFVITGPIKGSNYPAKFVGRPIKEIINETTHAPTNTDNFFERASAIRYSGFKGMQAYYDKADEFYESGKKENAYKEIDTAYEKVRSGKLLPGKDTSMEIANETGLSWDDLKQYAARGYEIASHTVTHAHLAIMDTANMLYELQKSKQDILDQLGAQHTFSAEVPFGIDDPRVMKTAIPVYASLRNLMPEPYMKEINRGDKTEPVTTDKEYVQWQRGPLSKTTLAKMESWIDTTLAHKNIWFVLVFHGIDSVGWESLPHELLDSYFQFIKKNEPNIWVATFGDVGRYMRERMDAKVTSKLDEDSISVSLIRSLDKSVYNIPLTLKTYIPAEWGKVRVTQGDKITESTPKKDEKGTYVLYPAYPDSASIVLMKEK
ncbi:MAG: polysaccharide deacetylase family protein [Ginsengibacter sp.]